MCELLADDVPIFTNTLEYKVLDIFHTYAMFLEMSLVKLWMPIFYSS